MCEINPFCQKVLRKHWPDLPIFSDIRELSKEVISNEPAIDIIYGGFPCQPFSVAGNKKGKDDERYLWPEFSRLVAEFKPRWILAENVPGILRIAADDVCSDLERQGYSVGIWDYEAAAVGALHRRERVFFVAHSGRALQSRSFKQGTLPEEAGEGITNQLERPGCSPAADPDSERCQEQRQSVKIQQELSTTGCDSRRQSEPRMGGLVNGFSAELDASRLDFWNTVPEPQDKTTYGVKDRTNRLKALGNAVVPQQAYPIFRAIIEADKSQEA